MKQGPPSKGPGQDGRRAEKPERRTSRVLGTQGSHSHIEGPAASELQAQAWQCPGVLPKPGHLAPGALGF